MAEKFKAEKELVTMIWNDDLAEDSDIELLHLSQWVSEHKYDYQTAYITKDNKIWQGSVSRTGSYYSEYDYSWDDVEFYEMEWIDYVVERLSEDKKQLKEIVEVLCVDDDTRELLDKYDVFPDDDDFDFDEIEEETGE